MSGMTQAASTKVLDIAPDVSPILDVLEDYSRFIDELFDQPKPHSAFWEGNVGNTAIRSVGRVVYKWRHSLIENQPPLALIVRLSRKLSDIVSDIGQHPRKILERRRSMEPVSRFRELDSTCVRWLIRQPGLSIVEKAGHRRQILAVQRFESVNTLENRVLVDLLKRCRTLAADYLRHHAGRFPNHVWIQATQRFKRICEQFVDSAELACVQSITSLPQPNYVLLHESRYHEVWLAYEQVIRQQTRRQQLWQSRQSVWAEMCLIAIWSSMSLLARKSGSGNCRSTHRCDLWVRDKLEDGGFIDWSSCPTDWKLDSVSRVSVVPAKVLANRFQTIRSGGDFSFVRMKAGGEEEFEDLVAVGLDLPDSNETEQQATVSVSFSKNGSVVSKDVPLDLLKRPDFFDDRLRGWFLDD